MGKWIRSLQRQRLAAWSLLVPAMLVFAGCGGGSPSPAGAVVAASPAIQKLYDGSCRTCHSVPASGAPQTGDAKAWAPRLRQGEDTLLDHAINGYGRMPPMGLCAQCSEDEFIALIQYMSGATPK